MKPSFFLLFLSLLFFTCCTRSLVPAWFDKKHNPNRHLYVESDGLTVIVENMEANGLHLVFDVEVINRTPFPVHVLPDRMYCYASDAPFPYGMQDNSSGEYEQGLAKNYAMAEKEVSDHFELMIKKQKRASLAMGLLSAGLIIFDVAMDAKDVNTGEWTKKKADNAMIRDVVTMSSLAVMDMAQQVTYTTAEKKGEDLFFLQDEILRPEVLFSGGSCRGKVFFPKSGGQYYKLIIPVGNTEYAFDFRYH